MPDQPIARRMWTRLEPIHAVTYFTPEARAAFEAVGLRGYWRGYFAGRAAPLGAVGAAPVVASFYGFAPAMVARALPDVWTRAAPAEALAARRAGAVAALGRLLADPSAVDSSTGPSASAAVTEAALTEVAELAVAAVRLLEPAGRVLGASNAALFDPTLSDPALSDPAPTDPALTDPAPTDGAAAPSSAAGRLWQAATTIREHRGDGHVAALLTYGFDGCESVVWRYHERHRAQMQPGRGWTDEEWESAVARLTARGWLDAGGAHTAAGEAVYAEVEAATDVAAGRVWELFGAERTVRLHDLLAPMAAATFHAIPGFNPMGVPDPTGA